MGVSDFFEKAFIETVGAMPKSAPLEDTSQYVVDTIHGTKDDDENEANSDKREFMGAISENGVVYEYYNRVLASDDDSEPDDVLDDDSDLANQLDRIPSFDDVDGSLLNDDEDESEDADFYADDMNFEDYDDDEEESELDDFDIDFAGEEDITPLSSESPSGLGGPEDDDFTSFPEADAEEEPAQNSEEANAGASAQKYSYDYASGKTTVSDSSSSEDNREFAERDPDELEEALRVQVAASNAETNDAMANDSSTRMTFSKAALFLIKNSVISGLSRNPNAKAVFLARKVLEKNPTQADFIMAWVYAHADLSLAKRLEDAGVLSDNARVLAAALRPENPRVEEYVANIESLLAEDTARIDELEYSLDTVLKCALISAAHSLGIMGSHEAYGQVENFKIPNPDLNHILYHLKKKLS